MRRILLLTVTLLLLVACQAGEEAVGPRTILDWEPPPGDLRPPPEQRSLPTPQPVGQPPESPTLEPAVPIEPVEVPELAPTPMSPNTYISEGNGFAVPFPSSWELLDSDDAFVRLYDPVLDVVVLSSTEFNDEETTYESMLEMFLADEEGYFDDLSVAFEEEISFAGDGTAKVAFVTGKDNTGAEVGLWFAFAVEGPRSYVFTAVGRPSDLEARQTSLKNIISQSGPAGAQLFGYEVSDTLVLLGYDPIVKQMDPARQTGSADSYIGLLYSGLVRLSPELQVEPDLAENWTISPDGREYTFTLREGIVFQSDKPITAADFQYSWERATDPDTDSTTAATYLGDILGVAEKISGESESISGVEVIDERTLRVKLDEPKPYFLLKLTYPTTYVVDKESVDPDNEEWVYDPNASGPYTLADFREETAVIFERNDSYYAPPAIPNVIQLLYRVGSRASLFEFGEVDIVYVGGNEAKSVREPDSELHDSWVSTTSMCTSMVMLNNTKAPMDDPNVRRAFAQAVDKEALNELMNEGLSLVAEGILPPAMPGYSAEAVQQRAAEGYDPEAVRATLATSEYASGLPPLTIIASGYGTTERDDVNALIADWQEVLGAELAVEYVDPQDFTRAARESDNHIVMYGWCADYPDPENFLDILFHTGSEFNVAGYSNPEIDAMLEEARTELDPAARLAMYQEIEAALMADSAAIPLDHGVSDALVNPRVQGYVLSPMGAPIIHRLSLEPVEEGG
jgi:oligopeptide transport system substrate-binding protein